MKCYRVNFLYVESMNFVLLDYSSASKAINLRAPSYYGDLNCCPGQHKRCLLRNLRSPLISLKRLALPTSSLV